MLSYFDSTAKVNDGNVSHSNYICNDHIKVSFKGLTGRQREKDWRYQSCIIYLHLCAQLSKSHGQVTRTVTSTYVSTLETWFVKNNKISVLLPLVKYLLFDSYTCYIPNNSLS